MEFIADEAITATNDYAAICKYQAVSKGYYEDPFLEKILPARAKSSMLRKAPEINRGYYARSSSVAYIVEQFIQNYPDGQIISFGAGYDSLFWRLNAHEFIIDPKCQRNVNFVEIDMSPVVYHKVMSIRRHKELSSAFKTIRYKGESLHTDNYHLISFDLRQVDKNPLKRALLDDCKLNPRKPTLCLFECVLVFMPVHDSASLINWLSDTFKDNLSLVNYEQCNMADRFGEIMMANMKARNCDLMGVEACKSLESQEDRFKINGLKETIGWTQLEIFKSRLYPASLQRIFGLELLDERELLEQLLEHYCIVIGSNRPIDWMRESEYWISKTTS